MCPSYLATGEEKHCTRGRAHLLHEMTRGEVIGDGWDSEAVEDSLSLCLACKGCKADCPVGVDVATWKAEFRSHHYARRLRPRSAYSMGLIDRWARLAGARRRSPRAARTAGEMARRHRSRASLPPFAPQSSAAGSAADHRGGGEQVLLWPDTFNNHFRPETLIAATELLERGGFEVIIPAEPLCCGRPLYDWGFLDKAKDRFERIFTVMQRKSTRKLRWWSWSRPARRHSRTSCPTCWPGASEANVCRLRSTILRISSPTTSTAFRVPRRRIGAGAGALPPPCGDRLR